MAAYLTELYFYSRAVYYKPMGCISVLCGNVSGSGVRSIYALFGNWHGLTAIGALLVLVAPAGLWDMVRDGRENWQDMTIEVNEHE